MADPLGADSPPSDPSLRDLSSQFDSLPIPTIEYLFFSQSNQSAHYEMFRSDMEVGRGFLDNVDFEINFDDLYLPDEAAGLLFADGYDPTSSASFAPASANEYPVSSDKPSNGSPPELENSGVSANPTVDIDGFLNFQSLEADSQCSPPVSSHDPGDQNSNNSPCVRVSSLPKPESGNCGDESPSDGPLSSQASGNCGSGVYEVLDSPSPNYGSIAVDQNVKLEETENGSAMKRKKEHDEGSTAHRDSKCRRSLAPQENSNQQYSPEFINEEEEKKKARLMRNRESAQLSRQRKKHYVEELEDKVSALNSTVADLNSKISLVLVENFSLRQQLTAAGMCTSPAYPHSPMAPVGMPWMPCAPYVVKPQGSQVPLVPIPRLKPQQPVSMSKVKKLESKKTDGKTKKVASISFLGLFFFILLFSGLVPIVNVKFGGYGDDVPVSSSYIREKFYYQHRGRVLRVNEVVNGSEEVKRLGCPGGKFDVSDCTKYERGQKPREGSEYGQKQDPDELLHLGNTKEPIVASLYVPRNNKLVKIDGNLIIHSVLASEKAMASQDAHQKKDHNATGLTIRRDQVLALAIPDTGTNRDRHPHVYRSPTEQQKALGSGTPKAFKDDLKSSSANGKLQQWFREGLAGPMLSSGMCAEVFQFDVSPTPGAIVPASSVGNASAQNHQNTTNINKGKNRRTLHQVPVSLDKETHCNITKHVKRETQKDYHGNKATSTMVVSVLVDPREASDNEIDGMVTQKSLSRIFVVVLFDSVKYVTYSCGLPRSNSHMVTSQG